MRSFAELLTYYMTRVGISDSEMARTLGVRRQTIFRWKEGLVERPRYREDILRCAARLRLSHEERDQLLLAAGFPPERQPAVVPQAATAGTDQPVSKAATDETDRAVAGKNGTAPESDGPAVTQRFMPSGRRWHLGRRSLYLVGLCALLVGTAALLWNGFSLRKEYPTATPGETLIVVGPLGSQAISQNGQERSAPQVSERIKAAMDRELQAARMERVQVALWPDEMNDEGKVTAALRRSGAQLVVGGSSTAGNRLDILLGAHGVAGNPQAPGQDQIGRLKIAAGSPTDVQLLALLVLAQLYSDGGDSGLASATLTRALSDLPDDQEAAALATKYAEQISKRVTLPK